MSKIFLVLLAVTLIFNAGCAKKQIIKPTETIVPQVSDTNKDSDEASVRFKDWKSIEGLVNISFDYDSYDLSDSARDVLKKNASYLKEYSIVSIIVEGYCDQRGTIEYNLALGQKRASAVRDYYISLGVPAGNIGTISYGKENLLDDSDTENAYAKNRRAETKVRGK